MIIQGLNTVTGSWLTQGLLVNDYEDVSVVIDYWIEQGGADESYFVRYNREDQLHGPLKLHEAHSHLRYMSAQKNGPGTGEMVVFTGRFKTQPGYNQPPHLPKVVRFYARGRIIAKGKEAETLSIVVYKFHIS